MLAANIDLVDIDPGHWRHWYELLVPPPLRGQVAWALVFVDGDRRPLAGTIHRPGEHDRARFAGLPAQGWGRAQTDAEPAPLELTPSGLQRAAEALAVDAVVVVDSAAVTELYDQISAALVVDDDLVAQGLSALRACKRYDGRGLWTHPPLLDRLPAVAYEPLQRTFDLLVPDRTSVVFYVFEDGGSGVHASLIAVKQRGHLDLVTTQLGVEDAFSGSALARGWKRDYRRLLALVEERYAPASLAVFLERQAFQRVATGPSDQLARELNAGSVVIDPAPTWLLGLLGGATMAAFASRGAKALARMLPSSARRMAAGLAQSAQTAIRDSGAHPFDLLGFDPIALWHDLRQLYRRH
ncbi:hypothetical protein [Haliangium sp.]|uniref:hypothetical protein n=1 Tax=Haliangium sp. TaxID=2663208 RepID=UPI003D0F0237